MKGKHQRTQRRRRQQALSAEVEKLAMEIEAETQRARRARDQAAQTTTARARLTRELAATNRRLRAKERSARRLVTGAVHGHDDIVAAIRNLRAADRELSAYTGNAALQQQLQAGIKSRFADIHHAPSTAFLTTWYRSRTGNELTITRDLSMAGWTPDNVPPTRLALFPYAKSTAHDRSPEASWAWAIPPWMNVPNGTDDAAELRRLLRATSS